MAHTFVGFVLALSVLFSPVVGYCPSTCECNRPEELHCSHLASLGDIQDRSLVKKLNITNHTITALKKGDLVGFTQLEVLNFTNGILERIEVGAFGDVNDTIRVVSVFLNKLEGVETQVFHDLAKLEKVYLRENKIRSVKAGTFVNLPNVKTIDLAGNNLTHIENQTFVNVSVLEELRFEFNKIRSLPLKNLSSIDSLKHLFLTQNQIPDTYDDGFLNFTSLETLELDGNPLEVVGAFPKIGEKFSKLNLGFTNVRTTDHNTWENLGNLKTLGLDHTHFSHLSLGMFYGLGNVSNLLMAFQHDLVHIGPDAFHGMDNLTNVDFRHSHKLNLIDETAFMSNKKLSDLFLTNCSLQNIPEFLAPWKDMNELDVQHNPIHCDCKMRWVLDNSKFGDNLNVKEALQNLECATPVVLLGMKLGQLSPNQFQCYNPDHKARVSTGIIVAIVVVVLVTLSAVMFKFRKQINARCRRYYQYSRYRNELVFTVDHDTSIAELEDTVDTKPLTNLKLEQVA
ncbi:leucine-rich repeat and immunoglobulin-like domain-containing nogo receptor-interacting protein 2 [Mya arenaria]|uniref:leucine-rich repeat and immunoglobulin-like domain-containing nogo receptor-interacting protein 2 n=1 Tax=Mya arenaria TaxID=6604 RepID=UPI0022E572A3|nr:leucine-rich repeat and immunoglobulin-like domain-containing nogo receptor-interacting protein 2 [Mya arenaria]